jgi:hypothetical protein
MQATSTHIYYSRRVKGDVAIECKTVAQWLAGPGDKGLTLARLAGDVTELETEADDRAPPLLRAGACRKVCGMGIEAAAALDPWPEAALSADDLCWMSAPPAAPPPAGPASLRWAAAAWAADVTRLADVSRSPPPYDRARSSALPAPYSASLGVGLLGKRQC